jgi:hypothetical protein
MTRALLLVALCAVACSESRPSPTEGLVAALQLDLLAPTPGSPGMPNTSRQATFNLTAWGDDGAPFPGDALVDLYVSYGGVLTGVTKSCGEAADQPIESFTIRGGSIMNHQVMLPVAYGSTAIWVQERGSHVAGASDPIYFPNPTIPNIQTPPDPMAANATFCSAFEKKFVTVDHATGSGDLLVDSVFGGAITATDTGATDFRSLYLFTFGKPAEDLVPGRHLKSFNGNISKFVGFTELNFPIIVADDDAPVEPQKLPPPIKLVQTDTGNLPKLNAANSSTVEISGKICPVAPPNPNHDSTIQNTIDQWIKYNTFVLGSVSCDSFTEFAVALPSKVVGNFDPVNMIGQPATVRGMLKNSSGQNAVTDAAGNPVACMPDGSCSTGTCVSGICKKMAYNFWTVTVRGPEDVPQ